MSNFLAIATVTAAIKQILQVAAAQAISGAMAETERPDSVKEPAGSDPIVNLYLFQVVHNASWRNSALPSRRSDGTVVNRPQTALDLHYILTFFGDDSNLQPQRLLGNSVVALNSHPYLTHADIESVTNVNPGDDTEYLIDSNLTTQVESVKISPLALDLEELSKMWSVLFQTPYSLSVAYQATVVLIEGAEAQQSALPVRARNIYGATFRQPVIESVRSEAGENDPIAIGSTIVIRGRQLLGDETQVLVGGVSKSTTSSTGSEISIVLVPDNAGQTFRAGVTGMQVVHSTLMGTPLAAHQGVASNVAAFVLHPKISASAVVDPVSDGSGHTSATLELTISPEVGQNQRVDLLLNEMSNGDSAAYSFVSTSRVADAETLSLPVSGVKPGEYLVRVQVDGAESQLEISANPLNPVYTGPKVTIP